MTITPAPIDPPEIHGLLWEMLEGEMGWDIGANTGQSLGEMSQRFKKVLTFEPAEECIPLLKQNIALFDNVVLWEIAVSDFDGHITLVDIPDKINTGQLVSLEAEGMEYDAKQQGAKMREVKALKVDTLVSKLGVENSPDFMKIDVEGHEWRVLSGAFNTLKNWKPDLLVEIHSTDLGRRIADYLYNFDYHIEVIRHPHYTARTGLQHMYDVHYWLKCWG